MACSHHRALAYAIPLAWNALPLYMCMGYTVCFFSVFCSHCLLRKAFLNRLAWNSHQSTLPVTPFPLICFVFFWTRITPWHILCVFCLPLPLESELTGARSVLFSALCPAPTQGLVCTWINEWRITTSTTCWMCLTCQVLFSYYL